MPLTTARKLRIRKGMKLLTINAPATFNKTALGWAEKPQVSETAKDYDQIHWFVMNKSEMQKQLDKVIRLLKEDLICWIYYPKGSSKIQTDLTRDKGWEELLRHDELQWISLISFDDTWSSFGMRLKSDSDQKKTSRPKQRPIFGYVDPATKKVRLPDDLKKVLVKNKKAHTFFETLSFTNKKEYIEWIVTAKREETRAERIKETIKRLRKNWNNPRNI